MMKTGFNVKEVWIGLDKMTDMSTWMKNDGTPAGEILWAPDQPNPALDSLCTYLNTDDSG